MNEVATIPETVTQWSEAPRLLVEWSSRWEEFKSAFRPALTRAPRRLAGEAPVGMFPYRGMLVSWLLECLLLIAVIVLPERFASLEIPLPPTRPQWDVIYYSGEELPQTQDRGGAQSGKSGRAGGRQAHHRTQTIRVARGDKPSEKVVDAPKVNLPHSDSAVANLLAFKPNPGPPPAEGLRSSLTAPTLPAMSVAPPSPELNSSASRRSDMLTPSIIPPAPNVSRDKMRTANPLAPTVIAPPPQDAQRDLASSRVPLTQTVDVVAPPVSAPQREVSSTPKLQLPAPAVVAPPPSQVSRDLNSWGSSATGDLRAKPFPPPPTASGGGSLARSGAGALTPQVVPPRRASTATVLSKAAADAPVNWQGGLRRRNVVPPPPGLGGGKALSGSGRGNKGIGAGGPLDLGSSVAPPSNAGGNAAGSGVVISSEPGTKVGVRLYRRRRSRHVAQRHSEKRSRWKRRRIGHRQRQWPRQRVARRRFRRGQRRHRARLRSQRTRWDFAVSWARRRGNWHRRHARHARRICGGRHDHRQPAQFRISRRRRPSYGPRTFLGE